MSQKNYSIICGCFAINMNDIKKFNQKNCVMSNDRVKFGENRLRNQGVMAM